MRSRTPHPRYKLKSNGCEVDDTTVKSAEPYTPSDATIADWEAGEVYYYVNTLVNYKGFVYISQIKFNKSHPDDRQAWRKLSHYPKPCEDKELKGYKVGDMIRVNGFNTLTNIEYDMIGRCAGKKAIIIEIDAAVAPVVKAKFANGATLWLADHTFQVIHCQSAYAANKYLEHQKKLEKGDLKLKNYKLESNSYKKPKYSEGFHCFIEKPTDEFNSYGAAICQLITLVSVRDTNQEPDTRSSDWYVMDIKPCEKSENRGAHFKYIKDQFATNDDGLVREDHIGNKTRKITTYKALRDTDKEPSSDSKDWVRVHVENRKTEKSKSAIAKEKHVEKQLAMSLYINVMKLYDEAVALEAKSRGHSGSSSMAGRWGANLTNIKAVIDKEEKLCEKGTLALEEVKRQIQCVVDTYNDKIYVESTGQFVDKDVLYEIMMVDRTNGGR
ncbi:hypothetical protein N9043_00790 [bacterium]|nr:hypothetical protein [bacterium]